MLMDSFPLGDGNLLSPVAAPKPYELILQHSCRMLEQILVLRAFCANIKPHFRPMNCPIHYWPTIEGITFRNR